MKQELLSSGRGYLTSSGRIDPDKLCWLFARLANEEEATFQAREVRTGAAMAWVSRGSGDAQVTWSAGCSMGQESVLCFHETWKGVKQFRHTSI